MNAERHQLKGTRMKNKTTGIHAKLDASSIQIVAALARADVRTVKKFLSGGDVSPRRADAIREAMSRLPELREMFS